MGYLNSNGLARVWKRITELLANKQDTISGVKGQVLGFNDQGLPVAQAPSITVAEAQQVRADVDFLFAMQVSNDAVVIDINAMAKKYYPTYWDKQRIDGLVFIGKLTQQQADAITATSS